MAEPRAEHEAESGGATTSSAPVSQQRDVLRSDSEALSPRLKSLVAIVFAAATGICTTTVGAGTVWAMWHDAKFAETLVAHLAATIARPMAGAGIAVLILMFHVASGGKIAFKLGALHLEGASGPMVLWAICLLCYAFCMRLVW